MSGETINLNVDDLTVGDLEDFEQIAGTTLDRALRAVTVFDDDGKPVKDDDGKTVKEVALSAKTLKAIIYISKRREDPSFTVEQARNVKVADLNIEGGDDDESPTEAAS